MPGWSELVLLSFAVFLVRWFHTAQLPDCIQKWKSMLLICGSTGLLQAVQLISFVIPVAELLWNIACTQCLKEVLYESRRLLVTVSTCLSVWHADNLTARNTSIVFLTYGSMWECVRRVSCQLIWVVQSYGHLTYFTDCVVREFITFSDFRFCFINIKANHCLSFQNNNSMLLDCKGLLQGEPWLSSVICTYYSMCQTVTEFKELKVILWC